MPYRRPWGRLEAAMSQAECLFDALRIARGMGAEIMEHPAVPDGKLWVVNRYTIAVPAGCSELTTAAGAPPNPEGSWA